ncbi:MAG: hypothetical protein GX800_13250 [Clostridiaceae bacterium]|jgi:hypothetical protein|nr:hypothetical protein [Clostridiaceae bacterium]
MHYKIKELHRLITTLRNEEGLSDYGVTLLEGYAVGLETVVKNCSIPAVSGSVFFTTEEVKDLKRVRNYFGEHDKTLFEHWAYSYLGNILKRIHTYR